VEIFLRDRDAIEFSTLEAMEPTWAGVALDCCTFRLASKTLLRVLMHKASQGTANIDPGLFLLTEPRDAIVLKAVLMEEQGLSD